MLEQLEQSAASTVCGWLAYPADEERCAPRMAFLLGDRLSNIAFGALVIGGSLRDRRRHGGCRRSRSVGLRSRPWTTFCSRRLGRSAGSTSYEGESARSADGAGAHRTYGDRDTTSQPFAFRNGMRIRAEMRNRRRRRGPIRPSTKGGHRRRRSQEQKVGHFGLGQHTMFKVTGEGLLPSVDRGARVDRAPRLSSANQWGRAPTDLHKKYAREPDLAAR